MSVFLKNDCKINNCGKFFTSLRDLIVHMEQEHLDFDPYKLKQLEDEQPECVPMSFILRYSSPDDPPPQYYKNEPIHVNESVINNAYDISSGLNEVIDMFDSFSNNFPHVNDRRFSVNSSKNKEEFLPELLEHMGQKLFVLDGKHKKPYKCNMPDCHKRYKNINGIKYHYRKHHKFHTQTFKSSILKYKAEVTPRRPKFERHELQGFPLLSFRPPVCTEVLNDLYPNIQRYEESEGFPPDYFYKFNHQLPPPPEFHIPNQVPLTNYTYHNNYTNNCYYNLSDYNVETDGYFDKNTNNFYISDFDHK